MPSRRIARGSTLLLVVVERSRTLLALPLLTRLARKLTWYLIRPSVNTIAQLVHPIILQLESELLI